MWVWSRRLLGVAWYATLRMGWPLEARRSLFPDWPWLCDESSPHRRALHISVQTLAGKFKMEFLPTVGLTKAPIRPNLHKVVSSSIRAFPVTQIRPNSHKIVSSYIGAFPVAQICPNSHEIVSSSIRVSSVAKIGPN